MLLWNKIDWCCCCCSCCEYLMWPLKLFLVLLCVIINSVAAVILSVVVKEEVKKDVLCLFLNSGGKGGIKSKFNCCCCCRSGCCFKFALLFPCLCLVCCFSKISFLKSSFCVLPLCWAYIKYYCHHYQIVCSPLYDIIHHYFHIVVQLRDN